MSELEKQLGEKLGKEPSWEAAPEEARTEFTIFAGVLWANTLSEHHLIMRWLYFYAGFRAGRRK